MYSEKFEKVIHGRNILPFFIMFDKKDHIPDYFEQLTDKDKETYKALQRRINYDRGQKNRARKPEIIREAVGMVDLFTQNDPAKSLVCGYYRFQDKILLNIRQFKILFSCCKSQCNIMLKNAGYKAVLDRPKIAELRILFNVELSDTFARCWSYRELQNTTPPQVIQSQSFTVETIPTAASPYWPYQIYKQVVLDQYDTNPVQDVELHFPEQDELTSPSPCCEEYEYEQYDPATNLCAIDLLWINNLLI